MSPRIAAVFGATGNQGSSVLNAVLADGTFAARAITRNPDSEASKALKTRGVEVVKADLIDKASIVKALQGTEVVFGVTNFMDPANYPANPKGEIEQGKNLVDAAKEAGVKFVVWSSLPSTTKISKGKFPNIIHYDGKAAVEEYLQASGVPYASVHTGGFLENLWNFGTLRKTPTGYTLAIPKYKPTAIQAFTWVTRDLGSSVVALFNNYNIPEKQVSGKAYPVVTFEIPYGSLAEHISKALGVEVTFTSPATSGIEELDEMFECQSTYDGLYRDTPVPNPGLVALGVKFGTLDEFLETEVKTRFT